MSFKILIIYLISLPRILACECKSNTNGRTFILDQNNSASIDYGQLYGITCKAHDSNLEPFCKDKSPSPLFCELNWCWVDPVTCADANPLQSAYFIDANEDPLWYSYEVCENQQEIPTDDCHELEPNIICCFHINGDDLMYTIVVASKDESGLIQILSNTHYLPKCVKFLSYTQLISNDCYQYETSCKDMTCDEINYYTSNYRIIKGYKQTNCNNYVDCQLNTDIKRNEYCSNKGYKFNLTVFDYYAGIQNSSMQCFVKLNTDKSFDNSLKISNLYNYYQQDKYTQHCSYNKYVNNYCFDYIAYNHTSTEYNDCLYYENEHKHQEEINNIANNTLDSLNVSCIKNNYQYNIHQECSIETDTSDNQYMISSSIKDLYPAIKIKFELLPFDDYFNEKFKKIRKDWNKSELKVNKIRPSICIVKLVETSDNCESRTNSTFSDLLIGF